jgi:uncharacterized membrane protein
MMEDFDVFVLARAVHVLGVVLWIGGVAFVTLVLLPALKTISDGEQRLSLFEQLEGRFANQARIVTVITGVAGFCMIEFMDVWQRYQLIEYWWMHLMTIIWVIFTLVLFVLEPLVLHRVFHKKAMQNSDRAFKLIHRMHKILLSLSLLAVFGAVAGSHGFQF